jgi:hypothetical protein
MNFPFLLAYWNIFYLKEKYCISEIFQKINEFNEQNESKTISKSENTIIVGISHRDDENNAIVNTILTNTK